MKKLFVFFLLNLAFCSAFCFDGVLSGTKGELHVVKTKYFDIIFPEECSETAEKIAGVADDYYREIASKLGYEPYQRFPVTITKQVEYVNAYFSMAPYNHIVIFDSPCDESIDMYEDTMEKVFYHELTHAVSLNSKNSFWRGLGYMADFLTPVGISLTDFWYEGVTVSFESMEKGGRLNDPFFTQCVVETKIKALAGEKEFPSWRDVTGSRDTYPYGNDAYEFGACFAHYLQVTYGLEKYARFWKNAGKFTTLSFCAGLFKKTYGISLSSAWNDFYEWIPVPQIDFSERKKFLSRAVSKNNSVIVSEDYWHGKNSHSAWYDKTSTGLYVDGKKVLTITGVKKIRFEDENRIYFQRLEDTSNYKSRFYLYNFVEKTLTETDEKDFLYVWSADKSVKAAVKKNGLEWCILAQNQKGKSKEYLLPGKIIHHLHLERENETQVSYVFTWAQLKNGGLEKERDNLFSRAGRIVFNKETLAAEVQLQNDDNFTGLVECCATDNEGVYFVISEEFFANPLRKMVIDWDSAEKIVPELYVKENEGESVSSETAKSFYDEANRFYILPSMLRGAILPFGFVSVRNHDFEDKGFIFLGTTFCTTTTWTGCLTIFSAGYDPVDKNGGAGISIKAGNHAITLNTDGTAIFDSKGLLQLYGKQTASLVLYRGRHSVFETGVEGMVLKGREGASSFYREKNRKYGCEGISSKGLAYLYYSNIHAFGPGYGQFLGMYLQPFVLGSYDDVIFTEKNDPSDRLRTKRKEFEAGAKIGVRLPGLFPLHLQTVLFNTEEDILSFSSQMVLFNKEIQKGIPAVSLYAQRITFDAVYSGRFSYDDGLNWSVTRLDSLKNKISRDYYSDTLALNVELTLAPNTSYFASSDFNFGLGYSVNYHFAGNEKNQWEYGIFANIAW